MPEKAEFLEWQLGRGQLRRFRLGPGRTLIGRAPSCDIWLSDPSVSRDHARLERDADGRWSIVDTRSANGTFVNGERVQIAAVHDGDRLKVGECQLTFRSRHAPVTADNLELEIPPTVKHAVVEDEAQSALGRGLAADVLNRLDAASRRVSHAGSLPQLCNLLAGEFAAVLRPDRIAIGAERGSGCHWLVVVDGEQQPVSGDDLPNRLVPRIEGLGENSMLAWQSVQEARPPAPGGEAAPNKSALLFRVEGSEGRLGYIYVESSRTDWRPTKGQREFLSLLVRQASLVWENLSFQEEHRNLNIAREVQTLLFPSDTDVHPRLDIAAQNIPALRVSGDYYDFQRIGEHKVVFIVADAMGHGLSAALQASSVQACFRLGVRSGWDLPQFDQRLHETVLPGGLEGRFVSGLLVLCDLEAGELTVHSAGHLWPSVICDGRVEVFDNEDEGTFFWGMPVPREPVVHTVPIRDKRWCMVAFTDGVVDCVDPDGQVYSPTRLVTQHGRVVDDSAKEVCESILTDVSEWSDKNKPMADDMTMVVVKTLPT